MKSIGEIIRAEAQREERETKALYAYERKRNAAEEMYNALKEAVFVIRVFHGDSGWDIYERQAPEMQRIKAALAKADGK